jgi:ketosteroid isomerase-like protein
MSTSGKYPASVGLALGAVLVFASTPEPSAAQFAGPEAQEVRAREEAFAKTMADRDFEAFLTFIAPEAVFFSGDAPLRGRQAIGEAWEGYFEGDRAPFSWRPDLVQALETGGLALSSGPVLNAAGEVVGRFNTIWRKERDGQWLVVFDKGS